MIDCLHLRHRLDCLLRLLRTYYRVRLLRHESWAGATGLVTVNDADAEPFRYIRLREPPYADADLQEVAATLRDPAYVFIQHEDEPTAPETARRLRELLD